MIRNPHRPIAPDAAPIAHVPPRPRIEGGRSRPVMQQSRHDWRLGFMHYHCIRCGHSVPQIIDPTELCPGKP